MSAVRDFDRSAIVAALAVGSIALLMIGAQPAVLGELVDRKAISLEGVGLVAMGEIIAVGVGVALADAFAPATRIRRVAVLAALLAAAFDAATLAMTSDVGFAVMRALAGLSEGLLVWVTISVVVRTRAPERLAGVFLVVQTMAQAAATALLAVAVIPRLAGRGRFSRSASSRPRRCCSRRFCPYRSNRSRPREPRVCALRGRSC